MANTRFIAQLLSTPVFTATGSDASYPLTNLIDYLPTTQWRGSATTVPQYLNIDVGATAGAAGIDTIVLHNCDFTTLIGGSTLVTLEAANDSGYSSGLATITLTGGNGAGFGTSDLYADSGITYYTFASTTKRYWRIKFATTALVEVARLGQVFLCKMFDTGTIPSLPLKDGVRIFQTSEMEALDGTIRASQPYNGRKRWKLSFKEGNALSDAKATEWETFLSVIRGRLYPFYYLDDAGSINYVKLENDEDLKEKIRYNLNQIPDISLKAFTVG